GLGVVVILSHVAHVGNKGRVESRAGVDDPVRLILKKLDAVATVVLRVELSVGNGHESEVLPRRRGGEPPVKGHREILLLRVGYGRSEIHPPPRTETGRGVKRSSESDGRRQIRSDGH